MAVDPVTPAGIQAKLEDARRMVRSAENFSATSILKACDTLGRHGDWHDRDIAARFTYALTRNVAPRGPQEAPTRRLEARVWTPAAMIGAAVAGAALAALISFDPMGRFAAYMHERDACQQACKMEIGE